MPGLGPNSLTRRGRAMRDEFHRFVVEHHGGKRTKKNSEQTQTPGAPEPPDETSGSEEN